MEYKNEKLESTTKWFQDSNRLRTLVIAIATLFVLMVAVSCLVGVRSAFAETNSSLGSSTASTNVYLQTDTSQLKFTAPTSINFMLDGSGDFEYPTNVSFTNDSVMDLQVEGYTVTSENGSTGVLDADESQYSGIQDVYSVKVNPTHSGVASTNAYSFSTTWTETSTNNEDWVIPVSDKTMGLTFSKGRMPRASRQWVDSDKKLQTVVWSVTAAKKAS